MSNAAVIGKKELLSNVPTANKTISEDSLLDLQLANSCLKFAQSNSVAVASKGWQKNCARSFPLV